MKAANDKSDWNDAIEATLKKGIEEFKKTGSW
jgi:hypothetical protein